MTQEPKKECDIDDLVCRIQVMNHLEMVKKLIGTEKFKSDFPELKGVETILTEHIQEKETSLREAYERCGIKPPGEEPLSEITEEKEPIREEGNLS